MSYFTFKGISSEYFQLKIKTLQPPQRAESTTETISVPGRAEPLIRSREEYQNVEIVFEVVLADPSIVRDVFSWLKGEGRLVYSDEPDKYYNAISNSLISVTRISNEIREFQIRFICKPFAYSIINTPVDNTFSNSPLTDNERTESISISVGGSYPCEPIYHVDWAGYLEVTVNNSANRLILDTGKTDGEYSDSICFGDTRAYAYHVPRKEIYIDTALRVAYMPEGGKKLVVNELTSGVFPLLDVGENTITLTLRRGEPFTHIMEDGTQRQYLYSQQNLYSFDITRNERWL